MPTLLPQINIPGTPEEDQISLAPPAPAPVDDQISFGGSKSQVPSEDVASRRSYKITTGTPELGKDYETVKEHLQAGDEGTLRTEAAAKMDAQKQQKFLIAQAGRKTKLTLDDVNTFIGPTQADSVFEDNYAKKQINAVFETSNLPNTPLYEATQEIPDYVQKVVDAGSGLRQRIEFAQTQLEKSEQILKDQSWGGYIADISKTVLPVYTDIKLRGQIEGVSRFSGLLGSNLEQQTRHLLSLPYPEYKERFTTIMDKLNEDNPSLAVTFAHAVRGQSTGDKTLNNIFSAIDITGAAGIAQTAGKVAVKGVRKLFLEGEAKRAVAEMVKAPTDAKVPAIATAEAVGDAGESAVKQESARFLGDVKGSSNPAREAMDRLPTFLDQDAVDVVSKPGSLGREGANRIAEQYGETKLNLLKVIAETSRLERIPEALATESALRRVRDSIKDKFPELSGSLIDITNPVFNPFGKNYNVDLILGKSSAELFPSKQQAINFANFHGFDPKYVEPKGATGWMIRLPKALNETDNVIRDLRYEAAQVKGKFQNPGGGLFGALDYVTKYRSADDTLSLQHTINRKAATYSQRVLYDLAKKEVDHIKDLSKGIVRIDPETGGKVGFIPSRLSAVAGWASRKNKELWTDWERTIKASREMNDENGLKGYFFKSPGELDEYYLTNFQRTASFEEHQAYFAYKRFLEIDRVLRNTALYRNKARLGAELHQFSTMAGGQFRKSDKVEGIRITRGDSLGGDQSNVFLVVGDNYGEEQVFKAGSFPRSLLKKLREGIQNGEYKLIEIYDPERKPLASFSDKKDIQGARIRYVISKNVASEPLSWDQVPRRGGGHFDFDYEHYIKQSKVHFDPVSKHKVYEGDITVMPVELRAMGNDFTEILNQARVLLRAGKEAAAKAFVEAKLPISYSEFSGWFKKSVKDGVEHPPRLNLTEPFRVVPNGKKIIDLDKNLESRVTENGKYKFMDGTKSGSLARQFEVEYTQARDGYELFSPYNDGTKYNPIWKLKKSDMVDPIPSMNRAMQRIVNSTFLDDYKIYAVENWLSEATSHLKGTPEDIKSSPFWWFYHAADNFKDGVPDNVKARLLGNKFKIQQFVGIPSKTETALHVISQNLADSIYNKFGPQGFKIPGTATRLDLPWMVARITDPFRYIRLMTFHAYLGLFSIPQVIVQAQTYSLIFGIAPRYATMGTQAALLHGWAALNRNPGVLEGLDKLASTKIIPGFPHWKPGEWLEANRELTKTGFGHVGGEYSLQNTQLTPNLIKSGASTMLDWGQYPFRAGEQSVRLGAWYTAFKEFREAHPTGALTNADRIEILNRADLYTSNMSRASHSMVNSGALQFTTQFLTYQIRNAELILGKRMADTVEGRIKARAGILAVYSAMYGTPMAVAGMTGLPIADYLRGKAFEHGYSMGENYLSTLLMEGIPSWTHAMITGDGDMQKGNFLNYGTRYGSQGLQFTSEALFGNRPMWNIIGGASTSLVSDIWTSTSYFRQAMTSFLREKVTGEPDPYPVTGQDILQAATAIRSLNQAYKGYLAVTTGQWLSKNGQKVEDVSKGGAIYMALMGLQTQAQTDMFIKKNFKEAELEVQSDVEKLYIEIFRKGVRAQAAGDPEQGRRYFIAARAYLEASQYPMEKRPQLMDMAAKGYESMIERSEKSYNYSKDVPMDRRDTATEAYRSFLKMQNKKQGIQ